MSDLVHYTLTDGVATITLSNGKVNALSPEVITDINSALDQAERDAAVVILTGQVGILSGGYDLKVMKTGPEATRDMVAAVAIDEPQIEPKPPEAMMLAMARPPRR